MGVIQDGTWPVNVKGTFLGKSKTGTGYIGVVFEEDAGDTITAYLYTSDAAIARTIETLEMLGWNPDANNGDLFTLHETELLVGAKAEIVVESEEYQGRVRPKVKWINAPGGGGGRAEGMAADEAKAFAAALRAKVYGTRAGKAPVAKAAAPKQAPARAAKPAPVRAAPSIDPGASGPLDDQGSDDDIPF